MNIADYRVEPADFKTDYHDLRYIRDEVFVIEQNIPESIEFDATDPNCYHVIARDNFHRPIGTARLSPEGKIGRLAVLVDWRNKGVGKALIVALLDKARKLGLTEVKLSAQTSALGFYRKFGFTPEGSIYSEAKIPHQLMRLSLEPVAKSSRPTPKPRGEIVEITETATLQDVLMASLYLVMNARKQLCIYTPDLEPVLYGNKDMVDALKQFAIGSGGGSVMIIVQDTLAVRSQPHPLLDLAQRLPSLFFFRTPVDVEDLQYSSSYLVNDRDGYLFRHLSYKTKGVWSPTLPSRNKQISEEFERVWQRSRPCTEFRALGL